MSLFFSGYLLAFRIASARKPSGVIATRYLVPSSLAVPAAYALASR